MRNIKKATFGGGCFWCVEAVIQRVNGIEKVVSGYAGGNTDNPDYRAICTGTTGHAEVIQVTYDADVISYKDIITIFMTTHDPTTLNRQGADRGTQYRSIIMPHDKDQKIEAVEVLEELKSIYGNKIVTEITPLEKFYPAEAYHQNYYNLNSSAGYCKIVIEPKVNKLRNKYSDLMKEELV